MSDTEEWVGRGIAGRALHVTSQTARRWALAGRVPHRRTLSGQVLFPLSVLRVLHNELAEAHYETFEESVGAELKATGGRQRFSTTRPLGNAPASRRITWRDDEAQSTAAGSGWQAIIVWADGFYEATVEFASGAVHSWSGGRSDQPANLVSCERWVRRTVQRRHTRTPGTPRVQP